MRSLYLIRTPKETKEMRTRKWLQFKDTWVSWPHSTSFFTAKWKKEGLCTRLGVFPALLSKSRGISPLGYKFVGSWGFFFICLDYCAFRKEVCSALSQVHVSATEFLLIIITKFALSCRGKILNCKTSKVSKINCNCDYGCFKVSEHFHGFCIKAP